MDWYRISEELDAAADTGSMYTIPMDAVPEIAQLVRERCEQLILQQCKFLMDMLNNTFGDHIWVTSPEHGCLHIRFRAGCTNDTLLWLYNTLEKNYVYTDDMSTEYTLAIVLKLHGILLRVKFDAYALNSRFCNEFDKNIEKWQKEYIALRTMDTQSDKTVWNLFYEATGTVPFTHAYSEDIF